MGIGGTMTTLSFFDRAITEFDRALRTLAGGSQPHSRPSPSTRIEAEPLEDNAKSIALMRVNHTGEVCAQALYQGQSLTAKLPHIRQEMRDAANEEQDHLAWCEERVTELGGRTSFLNPIWYGMSFSIGAVAGIISDKVSLGFVAATEDQVCAHLSSHLERLPLNDVKSREIVKVMLDDEARHAKTAIQAGGIRFPASVKKAMTASSTLMTKSSYYI